LSAMKCGRLLVTREISNGFGWRLIERRMKSSVFMSVLEVVRERKPYGVAYLPFIDNALFVNRFLGCL